MTEPRGDTEIRADLATIVGGISIRGAFGTTQAAHRLLDDVGPLLARVAELEAENSVLRTRHTRRRCGHKWASGEERNPHECIGAPSHLTRHSCGCGVKG